MNKSLGGVVRVASILSVAVLIVAIGISTAWLRRLIFSLGDEEGGMGVEIIPFPIISDQHKSHHSLTGPEKVEGEAKCDSGALTCLFSNLFYQHGQFTIFVRDVARIRNVTGVLILPGIGAPSPYYYIDTWSYFPEVLDDAGLREAKDRVTIEQSYNPDRPFRAILVKPLGQFIEDEDIVRVDTPTTIFALLWPKNLFRVLYAGAVALFTTYEWDAVPTSAMTRLNAALLDCELLSLPGDSFALLVEAFGTAQSLAELPNTQFWYRTAVLGLSQRGLLPEQMVAFPDHSSSLRASAFRFYGTLTRKWIDSKLSNSFQSPRNDTVGWRRRYEASLLGLQGNKDSPRVILVVRRDGRRRVLNIRELISHLRSMRINLKVVAFEDYPLRQQVSQVSSADMIIAVHGAALSHLFFMKPGATVIEIFPFIFRKSIYRNLANVLGIRYASWQCPRSSCSFPLPAADGGLVDGGGPVKGGSVDGEAVVGKGTGPSQDIDWRSQSSKDYWRNQGIQIDMVEFTSVLKVAFNYMRSQDGGEGSSTIKKGPRGKREEEERFLIHLPWEQFNNQLVGFKSACAVAYFLNRTLIVPPIGHRRSLSVEVERRVAGVIRTFAPKEYEWRSWTRYFDSRMLDRLPCRTAPFDAFTSLTRTVGNLLMRRLGQSARVNHHQLEDYFHHVAALEYNKVTSLPSYFPLYFESPEQIKHYLGRRYDRERVLALGTMFWAYSFRATLTFPLRGYEDKLQDDLYRRITSAFGAHPDLRTVAAELRSSLPHRYNALHLRRGDYGQKCYDEGMGASQEESILQSCYQRPMYLIGKLRAIRQLSAQPKDTIWFLATNDNNLADLRRYMKRLGVPTVTLPDLIAKVNPELMRTLDPIEMSILDQLICATAQEFIGNFFSSFTRTIVEARQLNGESSKFF